jgi:hypothetical protein
MIEKNNKHNFDAEIRSSRGRHKTVTTHAAKDAGGGMGVSHSSELGPPERVLAADSGLETG